MDPLFFTSYSHKNGDSKLKEFIARLKDEVFQRAGAASIDEVCFFDATGITTGEDWNKRLAIAVKQSKVCLAICTPAYVTSEFCGKEIRVFLERLRQWEVANPGISGRHIIPIIWIKADMPQDLKRFQYDDQKFPREYVENGLRTLCQLHRYEDQRTEVEIELAERIVAATKSTLPPRADLPDFFYVPSVFHDQGRGPRYGMALVPLIQNELAAQPYDNGPRLRQVMDEACADRIPLARAAPGSGNPAAASRRPGRS
jgi:hypothetical protein